MGQYLYQLPDSDDWVYPSIKTTSNVAGMHTMEDYLKTRWAYIENYATSTPSFRAVWMHSSGQNKTYLIT
jgi:hypothetical protein